MTDRTTDVPPESKSTTGLLSDAMNHVSGLVRKEIDLTRAEINENVKKAAAGIGAIVGAIVIALVALNVLTAALVAAVAELLGDEGGWAALIVGVIYLIIAAIMMKTGMNALKATSLAPTRAAKNVQRDAQAVKETVNG